MSDKDKKPQFCPACGILNDDDWPIEVDGEIKSGGCQECWESECDASWWKAVTAMDKIAAFISDDGNRNEPNCLVNAFYSKSPPIRQNKTKQKHEKIRR